MFCVSVTIDGEAWKGRWFRHVETAYSQDAPDRTPASIRVRTNQIVPPAWYLS
jgi:hypothetical protein